MRYRNASDVLPDELLKELKKYAAGEVLYIPSDEKRTAWGAKSGSRNFYRERNEDIRRKYFQMKQSVDALCDEYGLSADTIRKIIYTQVEP